MRNPLRATLVVLAAAALAVPPACSGEAGSGDTQGTSQGRTTPATIDLGGDPKVPPAPAFDPEPAHVIPVGPMDKPPVTLYGKAAWIADEAGLTVVDVTTGETVSRVEPENEPLYEAASPEDLSKEEGEDLQYRVLPPQLASVDGEPVVLATVPVEIPARNGGAPQRGIEVIAVGADDGEVIWRLPVDVYGEWDGRLGAAVWRPPYDGRAAVQWTLDGGLAGTFVVALDRPRVLWQRSDFLVVDGYANALVGFRHNGGDSYSVAGVALADGRDLWNASELIGDASVGGRYDDGYSAGPWTLAKVDGREPRLIEIATGHTALTEQTGLKAGMTCRMRRGGSAVLCASDVDGALALDIDSGEVLWQRPPGDGPGDWSGTVSTTSQGYAYIDRGDGLVVVDIGSGKVVGADPGILPDRANAYAGLVFTGTDVEIHLARETDGAAS